MNVYRRIYKYAVATRLSHWLWGKEPLDGLIAHVVIERPEGVIIDVIDVCGGVG